MVVLDISPDKLFVLGLVALVILGPDRLPQVARRLGHVLAAVRRMSAGLQDEVRKSLAEPADAIDAALGEWGPSNLPRSVRQGVHETLTPTRPASTTASAEPQGPQPQPEDPSLN